MDYKHENIKDEDDAYVRKIRMLTEREKGDLIDNCECCYYCGEPFKECDRLIPGIGVITGEVDVVKYLGNFWHLGCIEDWRKDNPAEDILPDNA